MTDSVRPSSACWRCRAALSSMSGSWTAGVAHRRSAAPASDGLARDLPRRVDDDVETHAVQRPLGRFQPAEWSSGLRHLCGMILLASTVLTPGRTSSWGRSAPRCGARLRRVDFRDRWISPHRRPCPHVHPRRGWKRSARRRNPGHGAGGRRSHRRGARRCGDGHQLPPEVDRDVRVHRRRGVRGPGHRVSRPAGRNGLRDPAGRACIITDRRNWSADRSWSRAVSISRQKGVWTSRWRAIPGRPPSTEGGQRCQARQRICQADQNIEVAARTGSGDPRRTRRWTT